MTEQKNDVDNTSGKNEELLNFCYRGSGGVNDMFAMFICIFTAGFGFPLVIASHLISRNSSLDNDEMRELLRLLKSDAEKDIVQASVQANGGKLRRKDLDKLVEHIEKVDDDTLQAELRTALS